MGQAAAKDKEGTFVGFDGPKRSSLGKRKSLENAKEVAKDAFFEYGDARNAINPIYLANERKDESVQPDLAGAFNVGHFLEMLTGKGKATEQNAQKVVDDDEAASSEEREISSSSSSEQAGEIGKYVRERKSFKTDDDVDSLVLKGSSHPIVVRGQIMLGEGLLVEDQSEWAVQYPLTDIQWFLSSAIGDDSVFDDQPSNHGHEYLLPAASLGRYVQIIATRTVEDVTGGADHRAAARDVYDPHLRENATLKPLVLKNVRSIAVVGPVLMMSSWAAICTALLSGAQRNLLKSYSRNLCVTSPSSLRKILAAILDEDLKRAEQLLEKKVVIMRATFKDSHTFVGQLGDKWMECLSLNKNTEYLWLTDYEEQGKIRLKYRDCHLGISFVRDKSFVPYLLLSPRHHNAAASLPLLLCPDSLLSDIYECPAAEGDLAFIFCLVNCLQAAEEASSLETRKRRFPSSRKEWQAALEKGDHSTVQDLLQAWLHKNRGVVSVGAQLAYV